MSLLAELLSKVKRSEGVKKDVPPGLMEIVAKGRKKGRTLERLVLLVSLSSLLLISGYYAVDYLRGEESVESIAAGNPPPPYVVEDIPRSAAAPTEGGKEEPAVMTSEEGPEKPSRGGTEPPGPPERAQAAIARPVDKEAQPDASGNEAPSNEADSYIYSGRHYEEEMNYSLALREYLNALRSRPGDAFLLNAVAYCYLRLEMPETALQYALQAITGSPQYVPAAVNAGICYAKMGNGQEAERYLKMAAGLDRVNRDALFNLGVLYEKEGRFEESLKMYNGLVRAGDYDSSIHAARILERTGREEEAGRVYRGVLNSGLASETVKKEAARRLGALTEQGPGSR
jgi:Flp pilus assembly protein TadD